MNDRFLSQNVFFPTSQKSNNESTTILDLIFTESSTSIFNRYILKIKIKSYQILVQLFSIITQVCCENDINSIINLQEINFQLKT